MPKLSIKLESFNPELKPKIKKLKLYPSEKAFSPLYQGEWVSFTKGHGLEFAGYRAYYFGDDARLIDWKASLRTGQLVVRELQEERLVNTFLLLDVSNSMLFGSKDKLKAEYAAEIACSLAYAILRSGDNVGLALFSDDYKSVVYPDHGGKTFKRITNILRDKNNYGGGYKLSQAIKKTMRLLQGHAMLIIISDFIGLEKNWHKWIELASQYFEVVGIMVRDVRDRVIPKIGQFQFQDPLTGDVMLFDAKKHGSYFENLVQKTERLIEEWFKRTRSSFIKLQTDQEFSKPLIEFFMEKYRLYM
ncbi:DUF58 domain-containing protein [Candidatus Woesearchaeota archaeon]|nr:DUF58 domain-containing protein [Candidatus Woesearchaeota archaeon]